MMYRDIPEKDTFSFNEMVQTNPDEQQEHLSEHNRLMNAYHLVMENIDYYDSDDRFALSFAAVLSKAYRNG